MKTTELKTNIMCNSCIANATPVLNQYFGENNWKVDISNPSKVLTVENYPDVEEAIKVVAKAGYKAEPLK